MQSYGSGGYKKFTKNAKPGNLLGLSGFETPFSDYERMSITKEIHRVPKKNDICHVLRFYPKSLVFKNSK